MVEKNGVIDLIDAKSDLPEFAFLKDDPIPPSFVQQLRNKSLAIAQNGPGYKGIIEVPTDEVKQRLLAIFVDKQISGLEVRVR